ncbi:hypothetical protein Tco_0782808 [Tanacetum coccineum]
MIAPKIPARTTPPAPMLSKKLFSDGVTPEAAACATSGTTIEAVKAAAVIAVTAFSFIELLTTILLHGAPNKVFEEDTLMVKGLKNMFVVGLLVNGMIAIETAEVEAIDKLGG